MDVMDRKGQNWKKPDISLMIWSDLEMIQEAHKTAESEPLINEDQDRVNDPDWAGLLVSTVLSKSYAIGSLGT